MALTLEAQPSGNWLPVRQPLIYTLSTDLTQASDYRFVVIVGVNGATIASFYFAPNAEGRVHFDAGTIARDFVQATTTNPSGGPLPAYTAHPLSPNPGMAASVVLEFREYNNGALVAGSLYESLFVVDGFVNISGGYNTGNADYHGTTTAANYWLTHRTSKDGVLTLNVHDDAYGHISFLSRDDVSDVVDFRIRLYSNATTLLDTLVLIDGQTGITAPNANPILNIKDTVANLHIMPANLDALYPGYSWTHCLVDARTGTGQRVGPTLRVNKRCLAPKHNPVTISWANSLGGWEFLPLSGRKRETQERRTKTYHPLAGTWNASDFSLPAHSSTRQAHHVEVTTTYELTTYITEDERPLVDSLISSRVQLLGSGSEWEPVLIESSSLDVRRNVLSRMYEVNFQVQLAQDSRC